MSPNAGEEGGCGVSANENSCAHHVTWSPNKLWGSNSIFNLWLHVLFRSWKECAASVFHTTRAVAEAPEKLKKNLSGSASKFGLHMWDKFDLSALLLANTLPVLQSFWCKTSFADLFLIFSKSFQTTSFSAYTVLKFFGCQIFLVLLEIFLSQIREQQLNLFQRFNRPHHFLPILYVLSSFLVLLGIYFRKRNQQLKKLRKTRFVDLGRYPHEK
jgi:hypothetical protein